VLHAQEFERIEISDRMSAFVDAQSGGDQLALSTEEGIVVFNSHWSKITAERFRKAITKSFGRQEIAYALNTVDRLDTFGGNAIYRDSLIIGHESFLTKFTPESVSAEIKELIEMWRWKEGVSRERLATHEPGSEREKSERAWMNTCKRRAEELETGFELVLPGLRFKDRISLDMGDVTLELIHFGRAGYDGMTIVKIPEERLAVIPGFIMHSQHLAPHPYAEYTPLDVPRWIEVLEELLGGQSGIDRVVVDTRYPWPREKAQAHLRYIKELWEVTKDAADKGMDLQAVQELCSLDGKFSFVKELHVYKNYGDEKVRPQHEAHTEVFFLQHGRDH
jgi:hypothetical protein